MRAAGVDAVTALTVLDVVNILCALGVLVCVLVLAWEWRGE